MSKYSTDELVKTLYDLSLLARRESVSAKIDAIIAKLRAGDQLIKFVLELPLLLVETGTGYEAPWKQVPKKWQKEFKSWCAEYKQQSWKGIWEKGWYNYHREFIKFIIDQAIAEYEGK